MFALVANAAFLAVEVVGGFAFGSLALLADAAHMATDVVVLAVAYAALRITQRPPTERHTFGFARTEVLVAQGNGLLLFAGAIVVIVEAIRRFGSPHEVERVGCARRRRDRPGRQPRERGGAVPARARQHEHARRVLAPVHRRARFDRRDRRGRRASRCSAPTGSIPPSRS